MSVHRLRLVISTLVGTLLVIAAWRTLQTLDVRALGAALRAAHPLWIALAGGAYALILPLWGVQWWLLAPRAERPSVRRMVALVAMTATVLNTTAYLVGEAAGVVLLSLRGGLSRGSAVAVLVMDQLLVGLAKLAVLAAAALLLTPPRWLFEGAVALAVGVAVLLAALAYCVGRAERVGAALARMSGAAAEGFRSAVAALEPLRCPTTAARTYGLALLKKGAEVLALLCVQRAFGVALPTGGAVLALAALNLATLLPVVPGNVGVYEGALILVYTRLGVSLERATAMSVVQHALYFAVLALPGYRWLLVPRVRTAVTMSRA